MWRRGHDELRMNRQQRSDLLMNLCMSRTVTGVGHASQDAGMSRDTDELIIRKMHTRLWPSTTATLESRVRVNARADAQFWLAETRSTGGSRRM